MKFIVIFFLMFLPPPSMSFKESQLKNVRVRTAYSEKEMLVKSYFKSINLAFNNFQLFLRAFKKEQKLEVWIKERGKEKFVFLKAYPFCASSGKPGPKRTQGDFQIPEGVYYIDRFNPQSNFYLSLGINYPNEADKILNPVKNPGGDIFIHGGCETIGCIPITDEKIKELYVLAVEAKNSGQQRIPIHIYPDRLDSGRLEQLAKEEAAGAELKSFWKNLQALYLDFETTRAIKEIKTDPTGKYLIEQ